MIDTLSNILGEKEALVYRSSLELGESSIADISKKAGLPRSSCYLILNDLKQKGLVSEITKNNKARILPEPPEKLVRFIERQQEHLKSQKQSVERSMSGLEAIYNNHPQKPNVRFYEGLEGVKTVLHETLLTQEIYVICSGYNEPIEKNLSTYLDSYFQEVHKRAIKTYELLGPAPDLDPYIEKYQSTQHQLKKLSIQQSSNSRRHIDKIIYNDTLILISFEFLNATVITHAPIVSLEKKLFLRLFSPL